MTETQLQQAVIAHARSLGWLVAHFRPGMNQRGRWMTAVQGDGAGFPDLVLVRDDRLLFVELKQDGRYPSPAQKQWAEGLAKVAETYLWRPKNWPAEIHAALA